MAEKIQYSDIEETIEKLNIEDGGELSSFSCGNDELDAFFHNDILMCAKYHHIAAYCARDISTREIIAVFTLANDAVILDDGDKDDFLQESSMKVNEEYIPWLQKQTSFPAINIGHLGVKKGLQSRGIGERILDFVVTTFSEFNLSGCQYITVDSLNNPRTNKFYSRYGFMNQTDTDMQRPTRRMYLPIELYREEDEPIE